MNRESIINEIYQSQLVEKLTDRYWSYTATNRDDFIQSIYVMICEIPEERLLRLYNDKSLDFYIISIIKNQAQCDYNKFRKLYHDDRISYIENYDKYDRVEE